MSTVVFRGVAAALALGITLAAAPAAAAPAPRAAAAPGELVLPAQQRAVPRATQLLNAGSSGFLWAQEGDDRLLWTDYATGEATALDQRLHSPLVYDVDTGYFMYGQNASFEKGWYGRGSDTVAFLVDGDAPRVVLHDKARKIGELALPAGHAYKGTFGSTVLTFTDGGDAHLWRDGVATPVTGLPDGATELTVEDGDARSVILRWKAPGEETGWGHWSIVDLAGGGATPLPDRVDEEDQGWEVQGFQLGTDTVLRNRSGRYKRDVLDRDDLTATPRTVDTGWIGYDATWGIVGSTLLAVERIQPGNNIYRGQPLWAFPADDPDDFTQRVMEPAANEILQAPDGSALVAGARLDVVGGDLEWGIYRLTRKADRKVARQLVTPVAPVPAQVHGLALGSGILTTADNSTSYQPSDIIGVYRSTWLTSPAPGTAPAVTRTSRDGSVRGDDGYCDNETVDGLRCITMFADGAGHRAPKPDLWTGKSELNVLYANGSAGRGPSIETGASSSELADVSGRYAVINSQPPGTQYIGEFKPGAAGAVLEKRDQVGAAVWGSTLWSAAKSGGAVTATRLPAKAAVESFTTRNGCTPSELQAAGRWVYWVCEDNWGDVHGAGIYDRTAKRTATAPDGDVMLGDGYLVEHVPGGGLRLLDLSGGLPANGDHAALPARTLVTEGELGRFGGSRTSWTVDRFGGGIAYADDEQRVHLVPAGSAPALTVIDSTVATGSAAWTGSWWLSKPAAGWELVFRNRAGAVLRTLSGSSAHGLLKAAWDGKDAGGKAVANGTFTWSLTVRPADGQGAALTVRSPALPAPPKPATLKATKKPAITGSAGVGSTVKVTAGTWTPAATSYSYKWMANGVTIKGATSSSYAVAPAVQGKRLTVTVTAKRTGHPSGAATSAATAVVAKGKASRATKKPTVTGKATIGKTVRASVGTWSPKVTSYRYEWRLNGKVIKGRTGATLKLTTSMRNKKITVTVIARRTGYQDGKATSKAVVVRR